MDDTSIYPEERLNLEGRMAYTFWAQSCRMKAVHAAHGEWGCLEVAPTPKSELQEARELAATGKIQISVVGSCLCGHVLFSADDAPGLLEFFADKPCKVCGKTYLRVHYTAYISDSWRRELEKQAYFRIGYIERAISAQKYLREFEEIFVKLHKIFALAR